MELFYGFFFLRIPSTTAAVELDKLCSFGLIRTDLGDFSSKNRKVCATAHQEMMTRTPSTNERKEISKSSTVSVRGSTADPIISSLNPSTS